MNDIKNMLDARKDLQQYLFCRGFLLTDQDIDISSFPFYGNWNEIAVSGNFRAYCHKLQKVSVVQKDGRAFVLCGHAYNPFTMEIDERVILSRISEAYGTDEYRERLDEITGLYVYAVVGETVEFECDPSGMQSAFYSVFYGHFFLTSHSQLLCDLFDFQMNALTQELLAYNWYYRVMGPYLPGDMTQFDEVKRIVPSISYSYDGESVTHKRFWPLTDIPEAVSEAEYNEVIREGADILRRNMELVSRKWKKPYISLTGGIDSNTTFSAANCIYDRFKAFSYISAEKEIRDAEAAEKIAARFGAERLLYRIPDSPETLKDYDEFVQIMEHNNGYIAPKYPSETRKRVYLLQNLDCDVEVKSWVSETIRAYWYKHYGRKTMPPLSAKLFRNLYKIFLVNRRLAHKIDRLFEEYIADFEYDKIPAAYPPADMHYNEVTWGSWGGLNISDMKIYSDITMIYNNRRFLDMMFRVPLEKRITDQHHLDMKRVLNPELADMNIRVVNMKETAFRAFALNVIFTVNSFLPF